MIGRYSDKSPLELALHVSVSVDKGSSGEGPLAVNVHRFSVLERRANRIRMEKYGSR